MPPPSNISGESQLIDGLCAWVEQTRGASLELPAEFSPLIESRRVLPDAGVGYLRMDPGPHTAGQVVRRFNTLRILVDSIARWSTAPAQQREPLPDYLHAQVRGLLPVSLEAALNWLRSCYAPVPNDLASALGIAAGANWAAACQQLLSPTELAADRQ